MKQLLKLIPITGLLTSMIGCNIASKITEKAVERKQNSLWLYYAVTPLIENMTGLQVLEVNIRIASVDMENSK